MKRYEQQLDQLITEKLRKLAASGDARSVYSKDFEYEVADEIIRSMEQSSQMAALEYLLSEKVSGLVQEDALLEVDHEEGCKVVCDMTTILYNAVVGQDPEEALTNLVVSEIIRKAKLLGVGLALTVAAAALKVLVVLVSIIKSML